MSHFYKLQNGLDTIIQTKYFAAFIIATINETMENVDEIL